MSDSTPPFEVSEDDHGKVRVLTLDRPEKLNAFTAAGYRTLAARLRRRRPTIR